MAGVTPPEPVLANAEARAIDTAWRIHAEVGNWTARVDAKASFMLTLDSAATAGIIALITDNRVLAHLQGWGSHFLLWIGGALIFASAVFAMLVVVPRLRVSRLKAESSSNFIYFGHLRYRHEGELAETLKEASILPVLSRQLIVMSRIAWEKHRHVQLSFVTFGMGAVLTFLAALVG